MTAGQLIATIRILLSEPNPNRWTEPYLLQLLSNASAQMGLEIDFPEAAYSIYTKAGVGLYQMIENIKILRVYMLAPGVSQTPLPGADINTLEGDVLMIYDQSSGTVIGNIQASPQFLAQQPQAYPLTNSPPTGYVPTALPYQDVSQGPQRGEYYMRGGYIGVTPAPSFGNGTIGASNQIVVDHVPVQTTFASDLDLSIYPSFFTDYLTFKTVGYCMLADKNSMGDSYLARAKEEVYNLRIWLDNRQATKPKRFVPITKRSYVDFDNFGGDGGSW